MAAGAVWVLNLDAEEELAARGGYTPSREMAERIAAQVPRARGVLAPGDELLEEVLARGERADGRRGVAWCPTPTALARLEAAGAVPDSAPPLEVLRRVNGRSFLHALGGDVPGARLARAVGDLEDLPRGEWRLQREHGTAGRGARDVRAGELTPADGRWIAASLRRGPLLVRPRVHVLAEYVRHGWLDPDGTLALGVPCEQVCDRHGQWVETRPAPGALDEPCTDLNARYTMGWRVGMQRPPTAG
jgi:hypothetical protein